MQNDATQIQASIARLATDGADAARIAGFAAALWGDVDAALSPIISQKGVAALYKRSLYLTRGEHPCLAEVHEGTLRPGAFDTLQTALSQQTSAHALAANGALLQTFCTLLSNLIGASLTSQLLRSISEPPSSGDAAQGTRQ